jgi:hypothetical protein
MSSFLNSGDRSPIPSPRILRFDSYEVDLQSGELRKGGRRVPLQAQPFQLLSLLVQSPGHLVTREEVRRELWPADTFVDFDRSLAILPNTQNLLKPCQSGVTASSESSTQSHPWNSVPVPPPRPLRQRTLPAKKQRAQES